MQLDMTDQDRAAKEAAEIYRGNKCFCGRPKQPVFPCCWGCWGRLPWHYKRPFYGKSGVALIRGVQTIKEYLEDSKGT